METTHLKEDGDIIKVANIHPGDWEKVCFTHGDGSGDDALDAISEFTGLKNSELEVINRRRDDTRWVEDFDWGIYFLYPPNRVEYFVMSNVKVAQGGAHPSDEFHCVPKHSAYFQVHTEHQIYKDRKNYFRLSLGKRKLEEISFRKIDLLEKDANKYPFLEEQRDALMRGEIEADEAVSRVRESGVDKKFSNEFYHKKDGGEWVRPE
jgi:hypothetical protein